MDWQNDIKAMHKAGCTDSDIEEYIDLHFMELNAKEIWNYAYELDAPSVCKGCKYIQRHGTHPCVNCARPKRIDYYEKREKS